MQLSVLLAIESLMLCFRLEFNFLEFLCFLLTHALIVLGIPTPTSNIHILLNMGWIQDLVVGGSDKRPLTLSNCYCYLTSPFFTRKKYGHNIWVCFTLGGSTEPPELQQIFRA